MDNLAGELLEILFTLLADGVGFGFSQTLYSRPSLALEVGRLIRQYREDKKMTQLALAQKMHVDAATVSRHEHGTSIPLDMLPEYADNLGVKLNKLIPDDEAFKGNTDEKQRKIDMTIDQFQRLHNLSDDKLDNVLNLVNGLVNLSLEVVDKNKEEPEK